MKNNILIIRVFFFLVCMLGCVLIWYQTGAWSLGRVMLVGMNMAALVILTDLLLDGFSLRSLSAVTFGLAIGGLIAFLITHSPLFAPIKDDPRMGQTIYLSSLVLYLASMYLATMIALRGKDEFNLVIPYIRFSPQNVESSLVEPTIFARPFSKGCRSVASFSNMRCGMHCLRRLRLLCCMSTG